MNNRYRLTFFHINWQDELISFDYPLLPLVGDSLDFDGQQFVISSRGFTLSNNDGLICVTLYGAMVDESNWGDVRWSRFKEKVKLKTGFSQTFNSDNNKNKEFQYDLLDALNAIKIELENIESNTKGL